MAIEKRFVQSVLRFKRLILAVTLLLTFIAGFYATKVGFDNSIEIWFLEGDETIKTYKDFQEQFGGDQVTVMALFTDDLFTTQSLELLKALSEEAAELPYTHRVRSLINSNVPHIVEDSLEISPLFKEMPTTAASQASLRQQVLSHPGLTTTLISPDGKGTAILVELSEEGYDYPNKVKLYDALKALRDKYADRLEDANATLLFSGGPILDAAFFSNTTRDSKLLGPVSFWLIVLCILIVFRRPMAVVMPVAVIMLALTWTFGLMGFLGIKINIISIMLLSIITAVGVADSIHVLSDFFHERTEGHDNETAVVNAISSLFMPCFFTSITTAAGMLALMVSDLSPVKQFGWLAALGVMLAFLFSITIGPILLLHVRAIPSNLKSDHGSSFIGRSLQWLAVGARPRAGLICVVAVLILGWALWSISQLNVGNNPLLYYKKSSPVRQATVRIDDTLSGTTQVEFIATMQPGGLKDPAVLQRLATFEQWGSELSGVVGALSVLDGLREIDRVLNQPPPPPLPADAPISRAAPGKLPKDSATAAQYLLLLEGEDDFELSVQEDYSIARITARGRISNAQQLTASLPAVNQHLAEHYDDDQLRIKMTGYGKVLGQMGLYLLESQIDSFLLAFLVVTLMLGVLLRSVKLAFFSMIPNFVPIVLGLGVMSALNISLDPGTVMIGAIALGLVVDDTVHFLMRFRRHITDGADMEEAISRSVHQAGRPILITSMVLVVSFSSMMLASFTPNINFGMITSLIIVLALLADLMLLPAALRVIRPRF